VKLTLLTSVTAGFCTHVTRTLARVVAGPVTTQLKVPVVVEVVASVVIRLNVVPPSRLTSMFTTCPVPRLWLNVRFREDPIPQVTAVLGDVTVIAAACMVKLVVVPLTAELAAQTTRMRAVVDAGPETTQS
jgi:hypothetical protein